MVEKCCLGADYDEMYIDGFMHSVDLLLAKIDNKELPPPSEAYIHYMLKSGEKMLNEIGKIESANDVNLHLFFVFSSKSVD